MWPDSTFCASTVGILHSPARQARGQVSRTKHGLPAHSRTRRNCGIVFAEVMKVSWGRVKTTRAPADRKSMGHERHEAGHTGARARCLLCTHGAGSRPVTRG